MIGVWWELTKVGFDEETDAMVFYDDWLPRESAPSYCPKTEAAFYYDGAVMGADVIALDWASANRRADKFEAELYASLG